MFRITGQTKDLKGKSTGGEDNEALLMHRIAGKDRKAFESLYYDYTPRIGSFLMKLLKSPELVDEAINETMLAVWQSADRFDSGQGKLSTWLFGIAHNKALKLLERQRKHWPEQELGAAEPGPGEGEWNEVTPVSVPIDPGNPERTVLSWELGDILVWALEQLTPEHRTVLELTFIELYTYQDIAAITGCPVNTVKTRMFHARKKMAELLARRGYSLYDFEEIGK